MIKQERNERVARSIMRPSERENPPSVPWKEEPKLNGVFARWDPETQAFYSKRGIKFKEHLLPELYQKMREVRPQLPFDGELWHEKLTLQQITGALGHERDEQKILPYPLRFVIFDAEIPGVPYFKRSQTVYEIVDAWNLNSTADLFELTDTNTDGKIYRHNLALYQYGTTGGVVKVKSWKELDATVLRPELGTGDTLFQNVMGSLRCTAQIDGRPFEFSVGSGFSHEERIEFLENPPSKIKVRYLHLSPDGFPLNPSYLGIDI